MTFTETSEDPLVGSTVANRYFVSKFLGRGGTGQVYKGTDLVLDRPIAIKVLNKALLKRFYIAMELLAGRSLAKLLSDEFPLAQARAVRIVAQVLAGLGEAHAHGIVHRDLKQTNVMVETRCDEPDLVKVLDFGIAELNGAGDGGDAIDGRSDLYAVGVLLYELLTGVRPFEAATPTGELTKQLDESPIPPVQRRPELDIAPDLDALVLKALSKDPADRWSTAEAMREALLFCELPRGPSLRHTPKPAPRSTVFLSATDGAPVARPAGQPPAVPGLRHFDRPAGPGPRSRAPQPSVGPAPSTGTTVLPQAVMPPPAAPVPAPPPARTTVLPEVSLLAAAAPPPGRDPTPAPAAPVRPATPEPLKAARADRSRRAAALPRRKPAMSTVVIGAGALLVLLAVSIWLFSSDPYAPPPAAPQVEVGPSLVRPGPPTPTATPTPTSPPASSR